VGIASWKANTWSSWPMLLSAGTLAGNDVDPVAKLAWLAAASEMTSADARKRDFMDMGGLLGLQ
jgi:hypothetical protein